MCSGDSTYATAYGLNTRADVRSAGGYTKPAEANSNPCADGGGNPYLGARANGEPRPIQG